MKVVSNPFNRDRAKTNVLAFERELARLEQAQVAEDHAVIRIIGTDPIYLLSYVLKQSKKITKIFRA